MNLSSSAPRGNRSGLILTHSWVKHAEVNSIFYLVTEIFPVMYPIITSGWNEFGLFPYAQGGNLAFSLGKIALPWLPYISVPSAD